MDEKMKSILAYIFGWIGGLVVLFGLKDNSRNTKIHAAQAIVLSAGLFVIIMIYNMLPIYIPMLSSLLNLVYVLAMVFGIVKAYKEQEPELPVIGDIAKNLFKKQIGEEGQDPIKEEPPVEGPGTGE